jgi:hypothetical protein
MRGCPGPWWRLKLKEDGTTRTTKKKKRRGGKNGGVANETRNKKTKERCERNNKELKK